MTITAADVVAKLKETKQPLVRWPGGYWSYKGCKQGTSGKTKLPVWYVGGVLVDRMERDGLLVRLNVWPEGWRDHRGLVEKVVTGGQPSAGAPQKDKQQITGLLGWGK